MSQSLAVIGPGAIAVEHLRAFAELGGTRNTWVVGRRPEPLAAFADEWGFAHHGTDPIAAISDDEVDVVLICSPNQLHVEQARAALLAGKHVIVEIPMAMNYPEAEQLVELATSVGRTFQVCHTMRSFAAIAHVHELVASGADSISQVNGYFGIPRRQNQGFQGQRSWVDDLLWHHACHLVDASLWVTGAASARAPRLLRGRPHPTLGMTMDLSLSFATESDQLVTHALTYNTADLNWQLRFVGNAGEYVFDNGRLLDGKGSVIVAGSSIRDLRSQNRSMLESITLGAPSDFDARSALPSMRCLQDLQESEGEW